ncbi:MAG: hypothetical protein FWD05_02525 [Oscillospiraceae bacterium]|nr:hypothetical protein [Oscillospiraceae bacterium]
MKQTRESLDRAIAHIEADAPYAKMPTRTKSIRIGEGRAVAILGRLRDVGGVMLQRDFEEVCLRNSRTLVGAGGFIARGSIIRRVTDGGEIEYELTEKGLETVNRWESRYGSGWINSLENPNILGNTDIHDQQRIGLFTQLVDG